MPWPCKIIEWLPGLTGNTLSIGDMFYWQDIKDPVDGYYDWPMMFGRKEVLSENYSTSGLTRPPILIFLPARIIFCIDGACWKLGPDGKTHYYGGWVVTGEAPLVTLYPSINCVGSYHGFIQNGIISDDCEGRKYNELGRVIK